MSARLRFVFVIFYFTAVLILTASLRSANNRIFYKLCTIKAQQSQLKPELWQKQLRLDNLINPATLSQRLDQESPRP